MNLQKILLLLTLFSFSQLLADKFCIIIDNGTKLYKGNEKIDFSNHFADIVFVGKYYDGTYEIIDGINLSKKNTSLYIDEKYLICENKNIPQSNGTIFAQKIKYNMNGKSIDSLLYKKAFVIDAKQIYSSPSTNTTLATKLKSQKIYFILKKSKERILLSKRYYLNIDSYNQNRNMDIIGWVEKKYIKEWDSRIAIEPSKNDIVAYLNSSFEYKNRYHNIIKIPRKYYELRYPILEDTNYFISIYYPPENIELYIPKYQKDKYQKVILIKKRLVRKLSIFYEELANIANQNNWNKKTMKDFKKRVKMKIYLLTGEEIKDEDNIAEFIKNKLQIPKSNILDFSLNKWLNILVRDKIISNSKYKIVLIKTLKKVSILLDAIYKERGYYDIKYINNSITYKELKDEKHNIKEIKRFFNILKKDNTRGKVSKNEWTYIPLELLP